MSKFILLVSTNLQKPKPWATLKDWCDFNKLSYNIFRQKKMPINYTDNEQNTYHIYKEEVNRFKG